MKKRQEMRKRCQALVLAGILGAGTLGSAYYGLRCRAGKKRRRLLERLLQEARETLGEANVVVK